MPWNPFDPADGESFELFAREVFAPGNDNAPALVYLQGGPGFAAPRPSAASGLIGEALKHYRLILLDQRGTGNSHRIDAASDPADLTAERLACLRQEFIVEDAEALRRALGITRWSLFGQSFGGFCITSYVSRHPESVDEALLTGGLPGASASISDVYNATFAALRTRHERFYREYPHAQARIREICHHLDNSDERLPTGERLSSRRFRTIGIELGRQHGFSSLAYLLEDPFSPTKNTLGERRLRRDFLAAVGAKVSFEAAPLYAAIHESIYGGVVDTSPTNWAAHRVREDHPGFAEDADPQGADPFYLTGEHIFPWQFDEDPALAPFRAAAHELAQRPWAHSPYDRDVLAAGASAPVAAAAVYLDDIFVPFAFSLDTAETYADCRVHVTNFYQHDGIAHGGAALFKLLRDKLADH